MVKSYSAVRGEPISEGGCLMARCPQCGMEVTNFTNHRHDSAAANYVPWSLLGSGSVWLLDSGH